MLDQKLLNILVCPVCKGDLRYDKAAAELLAVGMLKLPVGMAKPETAAWTVLGQALLNLSETITRN